MALLTCAPLLQPQPLQDLSEQLMFAEVGQFDVDSGPQTSPQVGRTGEYVAQMFIPHKLVATLLEQGLNLQTETVSTCSLTHIMTHS